MGLKESSVYQYFRNIKSFKWEIASKSLLVGLFAGLLSVIYRFMTEKLVGVSLIIYSHIKTNPLLVIPWLIAAAAGGLIIYLLVKLEPMASGGGVPQVEGLLLYGLKMKWYLVIAVRYAAGIIGSVFGMSFGPEGPSVQLGAAAGSGLSGRICKTNPGRDHLITAGAAAGLSAAFGAPLSGMIFALEEMQRSFSPSILLGAAVASIGSDVIAKIVFGMKPAFIFPEISQLPLKMYFLIILLGVFSGFIGILMNRGLLVSQVFYSKIPERFRPALGILFCLPFALLLPEILGGGHELVYLFEDGNYTLTAVLVLLFAKILFTCTSFGSGMPGGIFMPIISAGALSGCAFGLTADKFGLADGYMPLFVICAMAAGLSACVKTPVTCIVLTVELTGSFEFILPVAISVFAAFFVSELFKVHPVYEELLKRYMANHGRPSDEGANQRSDLLELPVECGCGIAGCMIKNIELPKDSLVVGIRRGSEELIPKGGTEILTGDYLLVAVPRGDEYEIAEKLSRLCRKAE